MIVRMCKRSPRSSSTKIQAQLPQCEVVSKRTIRRRLFDHGLKARRPAKKPLLTRKNIKDRVAFCRKYKHWTSDQWEDVLFSDEATFTQSYSFVRSVRRPVGCRDEAKYCVSAVKQCSKIMVWAAFSGKSGRAGMWIMKSGETINADMYTKILESKLLPFRDIHHIEFFQHDGAPCHTAKTVQTWLKKHKVSIIGPWPGSSPDLNPIENLWVILKRRVAASSPSSADDVKEKIKLAWVTEIPNDLCRNLARSMPSRIAAVLAAKGLHTKY